MLTTESLDNANIVDVSCRLIHPSELPVKQRHRQGFKTKYLCEMVTFVTGGKDSGNTLDGYERPQPTIGFCSKYPALGWLCAYACADEQRCQHSCEAVFS